jgi:hydrogenase nickel incorporation protein HypA/HybF
MHELSIAHALVKQVEDLVTREGALRAVAVTVEVGAMSGVDPEALAAAFPFASEDSPVVSKAELRLVKVPALAVCGDCGVQTSEIGLLACSACGSPRLKVGAGRSLNLLNVEIEV